MGLISMLVRPGQMEGKEVKKPNHGTNMMFFEWDEGQKSLEIEFSGKS